MNSPLARRSFCRTALLAGGLLVPILPLAVPRAHAQTYTWLGPGGSATAPTTGNWNLGTNWSTMTVPASSNTTALNFGGSGSTAYISTNNISPAPFVLNSIALSSTATVTDQVQGTIQIQFAGTTPAITQSGTGAFFITDPLNFSVDTLVTGSGSGTTQLSGAISGAGSLTKSNTGQLNVTAANNTFSGGVFLTAGGRLSSQNSGSLGTGTITIGGTSGPLWSIAVTANQSYSNPVVFNGAGGIEFPVAGTTLSGTVSIASGVTMILQNNGATGFGTMSGVISGAGGLQKQLGTGAGIVLSGNNTYTGTTTIIGGVLAITGTTSGQGNYAVGPNSANNIAGTLAGNGTIGLAAGKTLSTVGGITADTFAKQAIVSPSAPTTTTANAGIGTLSVVWAGASTGNNVNFGNYSTLAIDVGAASSSDRLVVGSMAVTGTLTLTSANNTNILALTSGTNAFDGSTYVIANYFGTRTGTFSNLTLDGTTQASATSFTAGGFNYTVTYGLTDPNGGFDISLVPTAVPEPATWAAALVLAAVGCAHPRGRTALRGLARLTRRAA